MLTFGTDGIRGQAGVAPLEKSTLTQLGCAIALSLEPEQSVLIARDSRESGLWIQEALTTGLISGGAHVAHAGILPTGALSAAVANSSYASGIMITASHNPPEDNGIKLLRSDGCKPTVSDQEHMLSYIGKTSTRKQGRVQQETVASVTSSWLSALPKPNLEGLHILLDCAYGAAAPHAPNILRQLGASLTLVGCTADGKKINLDCGALHPPIDLRGCDLAICFDGDADRLVMVDSNGVIDGDDMLWLMSPHVEGPLVGTIMSNGGLDVALKNRLHRSAVGDSNLAKKMDMLFAQMGAEPSGHILFSDGLPTGDGLYSALRLLSHVRPPFDRSWTRWPCHQKSIRYQGNKVPLSHFIVPDQARSDGQRVIVRYSGTEPKLRVLVEGPNAEDWLQRIITEVEAKLS